MSAPALPVLRRLLAIPAVPDPAKELARAAPANWMRKWWLVEGFSVSSTVNFAFLCNGLQKNFRMGMVTKHV
uniref:Uncharacterized protein n=1 Tax=Physcomitrium patens TaxID=3218 RepID=A0A2K1INH7_PHYPA|nr:hypothetical protein PHYPA_027136 [Physcomitrium patens]